MDSEKKLKEKNSDEDGRRRFPSQRIQTLTEIALAASANLVRPDSQRPALPPSPLVFPIMQIENESEELPRLPESYDFPQGDKYILEYWAESNAFKVTLEQSKNKPRFTFYDGPPFATGLPHYGHILAGTIKDTVCRYATQTGHYVERRFGWDTHGLPVEYEIDKKLNISGPQDVARMGVAAYNKECRDIVMKYAAEWEKTITRLGRWIDFENDYKTMYPSYMESVWFVFSLLYQNGLVYKGIKVMPYSTACCTPLSNFESGQNYKETTCKSVVVAFPLVEDEGSCLLVWTTTAWTLPSNLAVCINPRLTYRRIHVPARGKTFVILEGREAYVFPHDTYDIVEEFPGHQLLGSHYIPPFDYFYQKDNSRFVVVGDSFVTPDTGTGLVHMAPYFGEDDYRICLREKVITKDTPPICPVNETGHFTSEVKLLEGKYVQDVYPTVVTYLKQKDILISLIPFLHNYPYCWRSDTPLIYKAVTSWFVRVESFKDRLLQVTSKTHWVPENIRDRRFGNWLREARDWAISRNRYWGTPIPIWMSEDGEEVVCIESIRHLEELSGIKNIKDLHKEFVDEIVLPGKTGHGPLRRIPEVFDCWFESGSMPYAQANFTGQTLLKEFGTKFPADFIAEGIDQTRGWFYTLTVISAAIFGIAPYKNLIVNGLVLATDGQKMSKSKKNYPDPMKVTDNHGADALRLYLISSPVVRAENLRFKEDGVRDMVKDVLLPWYNAFRYLFQSLEVYKELWQCPFKFDPYDLPGSNFMDRWILSSLQTLIEFVRAEMSVYHLYTVVPRLTKFIDHLTNWYVRMNRKRLKGELGQNEFYMALNALFNVMQTMVSLMAPFTPFITEYMFHYLKRFEEQQLWVTVHQTSYPLPNRDYQDTSIELAVSRMQSVIDLGRVIRERKTLPMKYPLPEVIIIHPDNTYIRDIMSLESYILSELNVRKMTTTTIQSQYGIRQHAEPDYKRLGKRLKGALKDVAAQIVAMDQEDIEKMKKDRYRIINGHQISVEDVRFVFRSTNAKFDQYESNTDNEVLILLNVNLDSRLQDEGLAREIISRVQKMRKKAKLFPTDQVKVYYMTEGLLERISREFKDYIDNALKAPYSPLENRCVGERLLIEHHCKLKNCDFYVIITTASDSEQLLTGQSNTVAPVSDSGDQEGAVGYK